MGAPAVSEWLAALEARHLADLRLPEVTRALRALSSAYVERRHLLSRGSALDTAGKRAAFSLFYSPLHFLTASHILTALRAALPAQGSILDLGCGTGVCGAAWSLISGGRPRVLGIDSHPATVDEARWTYRQLGVDGTAKRGDMVRIRPPRGVAAMIAGYALNELPENARGRVWGTLRAAAEEGAQVLILEPIARGLTPWWDALAEEAVTIGGRADEWRFRTELPEIVARLDRAAGLNHAELTARSIYVPGASAGANLT